MKLVEGSDEEPVAITPDCEGCRYRFADGHYDEVNNRLIMIREDHTNPAPKDVCHWCSANITVKMHQGGDKGEPRESTEVLERARMWNLVVLNTRRRGRRVY